MIAKDVVVAKIIELVQPILVQEELELVDVAYEKEGAQWFLRVFIDCKGGIDIEDTARVSEILSAKMDQVEPNPFKDVDFLEVSSPGCERELKSNDDYQNALGKYIHISLYSQVDNRQSYEGDLLKYDEEKLTLTFKNKTKLEEKKFARKNIAQARLAVKF